MKRKIVLISIVLNNMPDLIRYGGYILNSVLACGKALDRGHRTALLRERRIKIIIQRRKRVLADAGQRGHLITIARALKRVVLSGSRRIIIVACMSIMIGRIRVRFRLFAALLARRLSDILRLIKVIHPEIWVFVYMLLRDWTDRWRLIRLKIVRDLLIGHVVAVIRENRRIDITDVAGYNAITQ